MPEPAPTTYIHQSSSGGSNVKIAILFGAVLALLAANVWLFLQLDNVKQDLGKMRENLQGEIATLREASSVTAQTQRRTVESLRDELETARRQAAMAVGQAKTDAESKVTEINKRLMEEQKKAVAVQAALRSEIGEVKKDTVTAQEKIAAVNTEVGAVKEEVKGAKTDIEKTLSDLKRVTGDLGVQSGLIATNAKELSQLRALGERNYFEFNLGKTKQPVKVGDIAVLLKRVDTKRNRYTIEVFADDKKTEKKDRTINEPVQFYTSKARQPYELVVNEVKKDTIVGYLSTPKVVAAR